MFPSIQGPSTNEVSLIKHISFNNEDNCISDIGPCGIDGVREGYFITGA